MLILVVALCLSINFQVTSQHRRRPNKESPPLSSWIEEPIVNEHFDYIHNPERACGRLPAVEMLVAVPVKTDQFEARNAIRQTWGINAHNPSLRTVIVFFVGLHNGPDALAVHNAIDQESRQFGDVVQEGFIDSYMNLTLKSVSILRWAEQFCQNREYLLKIDSDVYVAIPKLVATLRLRDKTDRPFVMGEFRAKGVGVIRRPTSKFFIGKDVYAPDIYPPYLTGAAYVISSRAIGLIYQMALRTHLFPFEDIYVTGFCAEKAGIRQVHHEGFRFKFAPSPMTACDFGNTILTMKYSASGLIRLHEELTGASLDLDKCRRWRLTGFADRCLKLSLMVTCLTFMFIMYKWLLRKFYLISLE